MNKISIVIGRFQPFHKQHLELVKEALDVSDRVIICIGSVNQSRTMKNPFTFEQRKVIITTTLINAGIDVGNVSYEGLEDKPTDDEWLKQITSKLEDETTYTLVGYHKDDSSYYLDLFEDFGISYHEFESKGEMSATFIRQSWYSNYSSCNLADSVDAGVAKLLVNTRNQQWYKDLLDENRYICQQKDVFKDYPYPDSLNVCTADAVIVNPDGEVCFIRRGSQPQKGLLALVGGHKESNETFLQAAKREAEEEVGVKGNELFLLGQPIISDNPDRDPSMTKVSVAYIFTVLDWKKLTPNDDAVKIEWIKWKDIPDFKSEIAFDHFEIAQKAFAQKTAATYL